MLEEGLTALLQYDTHCLAMNTRLVRCISFNFAARRRESFKQLCCRRSYSILLLLHAASAGGEVRVDSHGVAQWQWYGRDTLNVRTVMMDGNEEVKSEVRQKKHVSWHAIPEIRA